MYPPMVIILHRMLLISPVTNLFSLAPASSFSASLTSSFPPKNMEMVLDMQQNYQITTRLLWRITLCHKQFFSIMTRIEWTDIFLNNRVEVHVSPPFLFCPHAHKHDALRVWKYSTKISLLKWVDQKAMRWDTWTVSSCSIQEIETSLLRYTTFTAIDYVEV